MIKIIKVNNNYRFLKNNQNLKTENGNILFVKRKKHAELIIEAFLQRAKPKDPNTLLNLTLFSCNLCKNDIEEIKKQIIELLNFDLLLFRSFDETELVETMEKEFDPFICEFEDLFKCRFEKIFSIVHPGNLKHLLFKSYLDKLDIFKLTTLFKLSLLTKSVILSYFFVNKKINYKTLYKLTNIEYNYQQKRWGTVEEQLLMNKDFIERIKNISFFFKNIS